MSTMWSTGRATTNGAQRDSDRLRADVDATHRRLELLLGELDRRRREAFDLRLQMRRHPLVFAAAATLALGAVGGGTALAIARVRRPRSRRRLSTARLWRLWQLSRGHRAIGAARSAPLGWLAMRAAKVAMVIVVRLLVRRAASRRRDD